MEMSSSFAERDAEEANGEAETPGASERRAAKPSEERDAHRPREDRSKARAMWPSIEIISIKTCLCSRTYCCSEFQESRVPLEVK